MELQGRQHPSNSHLANLALRKGEFHMILSWLHHILVFSWLCNMYCCNASFPTRGFGWITSLSNELCEMWDMPILTFTSDSIWCSVLCLVPLLVTTYDITALARGNSKEEAPSHREGYLMVQQFLCFYIPPRSKGPLNVSWRWVYSTVRGFEGGGVASQHDLRLTQHTNKTLGTFHWSPSLLVPHPVGWHILTASPREVGAFFWAVQKMTSSSQRWLLAGDKSQSPP